MKKRILIFTPLVLFLFVCTYILIVFPEIMNTIQRNPFDDPPWLSTRAYKFDPHHILDALDTDETDELFTLYEHEIKPSNVDNEWEYGTFAWSQEEFLKIAEAHHLFLTGEAVTEGWQLYSYFNFVTSGCTQNINGFEIARIIYYKTENDKFPVTFMVIRPHYPVIHSASVYYVRETLPFPFREVYYPAEIDKWEITVDEALQIAENAGGRSARDELINLDSCDINISIYYVGGDSLYVDYEGVTKSRDKYSRLFEIEVNPYDGSYDILYPWKKE